MTFFLVKQAIESGEILPVTAYNINYKNSSYYLFYHAGSATHVAMICETSYY